MFLAQAIHMQRISVAVTSTMLLRNGLLQHVSAAMPSQSVSKLYVGCLLCSVVMKLQRLQNNVLRTIGNFSRRTPVREFHKAFSIPYIYDYITKLPYRRVVTSTW
jgi:hypothetical protein